MAFVNTLANYDMPTNTAVKGLIVQAPGGILIAKFFGVNIVIIFVG
jgi:hypothetical protein